MFCISVHWILASCLEMAIPLKLQSVSGITHLTKTRDRSTPIKSHGRDIIHRSSTFMGLGNGQPLEIFTGERPLGASVNPELQLLFIVFTVPVNKGANKGAYSHP